MMLGDEVWLPQLVEIETWKTDSDDPDYWKQFGWENLEVPDDCPTVAGRMAQLKMRFDERYAYRMLNSETMERWQVRLQNRFDENVRRYERAYTMYSRYETDMMDDVLEGERIVTESSVKQGGSDSTDTTTRNIDTPDEAVNQDENYASNLSHVNGKVTYGRSDTGRTETVRTVTGKSLVDSVNDSMDRWRDVDTGFVKEFENLFLNIFWY